MWYQFLRTFTPRFQRQKPLGGYIADFYCAKARLVIELDGALHYTPEQQQTDSLRTEFFRTEPYQGSAVHQFGHRPPL